MSMWGWILVAVGAAVLLLVGLRQALAHRRSRQLRDPSGPEYYLVDGGVGREQA